MTAVQDQLFYRKYTHVRGGVDEFTWEKCKRSEVTSESTTPQETDAEGPARGHRAGSSGDTACHSVIAPPIRPIKTKGLRIKVWKNANFMEAERVINNKYEIKDDPEAKDKPKRGLVSVCSKASMVRLRKFLAKILASEEARTGCLTYPQKDLTLCPNAKGAKKDLQRLQRWVNKRYSWLGLVWKREPHESGITHFHMLFFLNGRSDAEVREGWNAVVTKWCKITTGEGTSFSEAEHAKQLSVHLHDKNYQEVKKGMSFFNYLGKYLSKGSNVVPEGYDNEGGGNWWGVFCKASLPIVEPIEATRKLNDKLEKDMMRTMYKIRDKRKQAGFDSLSCISDTPRQDRDVLARAYWNAGKNEGLTYRQAEKKATRVIFKMDGSRRSLTAPIKVNGAWHFGTCSLMGAPAPVLAHLKRQCSNGAADPVARARVFSDNYKSPQKEDHYE